MALERVGRRRYFITVGAFVHLGRVRFEVLGEIGPFVQPYITAAALDALRPFLLVHVQEMVEQLENVKNVKITGYSTKRIMAKIQGE